MNITKCNECKGTNIILTQDLKGNIFAATCLSCGWEFESDKFKTMYKEFDDSLKEFDRSAILMSKKK